jgi:hypothetical protein
MRFTITPLGSAIADPVAGRLARSTGEITAWKLHQAAQQHAFERDVDTIGP